jgi:hypothetical protein
MQGMTSKEVSFRPRLSIADGRVIRQPAKFLVG